MLRCFDDGKNDTFEIFQHVVIGEAQYAIASRLEPAVTPPVMTNALFEVMAFAIDFDDQLAGMCDEIGDVVSDWSLSTETETGETIGFEMAP